MKKLKYAVLISSVVVFSACNLETREDMRKSDEDRQMKEQVSSMQKSKADVELRYSDLQNDVRTMAGRIETMDHNAQVNNQNNRQDMEAMKKMVEAQNEKIKLLQAHMDATETRLTAAIQALSGNGSVAVPQGKTGGVAVDGGAGAVATKEPTGPYEEAEGYFSAKDYKKAIVKYQNYIDKNSKGKNVAEATYKIGVCFAELGLKKDAKEFYKDVIDNHAGSSWAKKAKYRLSHLK